MKHTLRAAICGVLTACGSYACSSPTPPSATGTIAGVVSSATGGGGISGATVSVAGLSAPTNGAGAYSIAGVPSGAQAVQTTAAGFVARTDTIQVAANTSTSFSPALNATTTPTPQLAIWTSASRGYSRIDVQVDGKSVGSLTAYYTSSPGCIATTTGVIVIPTTQGSHSFTAKADTGTSWSGTATVGTGCVTEELACTNGDCGGGSNNGGSAGQSAQQCASFSDAGAAGPGYSHANNSCSFQIFVSWIDQGSCKADSRGFATCAATPGAHGFELITALKGQYIYAACNYPYGPVDPGRTSGWSGGPFVCRE